MGEAKAEDMLGELRKSLETAAIPLARPADEERFSLIWLVDDFSGSGNTYIRFDGTERRFKGKICKIYDRVLAGDLMDPDYYEVYLLLYVATRQAIDHIEYWSERFTTEQGFKPLRLHVLCPIEKDAALASRSEPALISVLGKEAYYDKKASDRHIAIGGTQSAQFGFAGCSLPLVLSHNTPNNSVYVLWGPEDYRFFGLFPRVSRHRET